MRHLARLALALLAITLLTINLSAQPFPRDDADEYRWFTADYHWLEIEDVGQQITELDDNGFVGPIEIGFDFPFYGQLYHQVYVGSNGLIGFDPEGLSESANTDLPNNNRPNNLIALYWKDLALQTFWADGALYYGTREGKFVIEYQNYPEVNLDGHQPANSITMQAVLSEDGDIVLQYARIGDSFGLGVGTIGTENEAGDQGVSIRFNGQGERVASRAAFLISEHGPGNYLVWDAGTITTSGDAEEAALRAEGHSVSHLRLGMNQQLPDDLSAYRAVFVNLGNYGVNGRNYHRVTEAEGAILERYLNIGGALYLEGGDAWTRDPVTPVHPYFRIEGVDDGHSLATPVEGVRGGLAENLAFDGYRAEENVWVDQLRPQEGAQPVMTFRDGDATPVGMVSYLDRRYRTIGSSFEFGGLVDGVGGSKRTLMRAFLSFFRSAPPEFPAPIGFDVTAGNGSATLRWGMPPRGGNVRRLEIQHQIADMLPRTGKPSEDVRASIGELKSALELLDAAQPQRDELRGFNIFVDSVFYDFTDGLSYTVADLRNGQTYAFGVSAVYRDPAGESDTTGYLFATPVASWTPEVTANFEQTDGSLIPTPNRGGWSWGHPAAGAAGGERAWGAMLEGGYPDNADLSLMTPPIDLSQVQGALLEFKTKYEFEAGWDGGRWEASVDDGQSWSAVLPLNGYPNQFVYAFGNRPAYTGRSNGWVAGAVDLSAYDGQVVRLRLHLLSDESNLRPYLGWQLDDLHIYSPRYGSVTLGAMDGGNGNALPGVRFTLREGLSGVSDGRGQYRFTKLLPGDYVGQAVLHGYGQAEFRFTLAPSLDTAFAVSLSQYGSRLAVDPNEIQERVDYGNQSQRRITVTNNGNVPTSFQVFLDYWPQQQGRAIGEPAIQLEEPRRDQPWDLIRTFDLSAATGDQSIIAGEMIHNGAPEYYQFVVGAGQYTTGGCKFYLLDRTGTQQGQPFAQAEQVGWGVRDLAYDGLHIFGSDTGSIYEFNPVSGMRTGLFGSPLNIARAIAYVPEDGTFWIGDRDDSWFRIRRVGATDYEVIDQVANHGLNGVVGMAWNPDDPDGACLYIHNQESNNGGAAVYRFNTRTRQLTRQLVTATPEQGVAGGLFTTYLYDTQNWILGAVIQGPQGDQLKLYELWPHRSWISASPATGQINAGERAEVTLNFDGRLFVDNDVNGAVEVFDLNRPFPVAATTAQISFSVNGGAASQSGTLSLDRAGDLRDLASLTLNGISGAFDPETGAYSFNDRSPGRYILRAEMPGFQPFASDSFSLDANQNRRQDIRLTHLFRGRVQGTVRSSYGVDSVMAGVEIAATLRAGVGYGAGVTDEDGWYEIDLPAGDYTVQALKDGWRVQEPQNRNITVRDNEGVNVNLVLDDHLAVRALYADSTWDSCVVLRWAPPGLTGTPSAMQYDNGLLGNAIYLRGRRDMIAAKYEPEGMYDITDISFYTTRPGDLGNFTGWPDRYVDGIYLEVYAQDPDVDQPGELLWEYYADTTRSRGWWTVNPNGLRFMRGPFYIAWHQDPAGAAGRYDAVGLDNRLDHEGMIFTQIDGAWDRLENLPGDLMLRAHVLQYQLDDRQQQAPRRPARLVGVEDLPGLKLLNPEVAIGELLPQPVYSESKPKTDPPRRDRLTGFTLLRDDQIIANGIPDTIRSWIDTLRSTNENHRYRYQVVASYADQRRLDGLQIQAACNEAPDTVIALRTTVNGLNYTVAWRNPLTNNIHRGRCIDQAGTEIALNGQVVGRVNYPDSTFTGQIAQGGEGWYDISAVAFDEVPNRSPVKSARVALGANNYYGFEVREANSLTGQVGQWAKAVIRNGPGAAHGGDYAWATASAVGNYENNADWLLTTMNEYLITGQNARVEFFHFISAENGRDGGELLVSVDGGVWSLLRPVGDYPDQTVAAFGNGPAWTGDTGGWTFVSADLSPYRGHTVKLRWRFRSDQSINWYPGWFIDDLAIWGGSVVTFAQATGTVRDQNGQAIGGAAVSCGRVSVNSALNGTYRLTGITPGLQTVIASKAGFAPATHQFNFQQRDSLRIDFDVYRPALSLDQGQIGFQLGGNDRVETELHLQNAGDRAVPYLIRLTGLSPDRDAADREVRNVANGELDRDNPGDIHFDYDLTSVTSQRRIMGAEYAADQFFVTSADPDRGLMVSVMNRDGGMTRQFRQPMPQPVGWGLRDLAWDGNYLYGSQNDSIYGFSLQGDLHSVQPGAPLTVNRALAWDQETDCFWTGEWDSPWYKVDRIGRIRAEWDGHGLTGVYGFAYHPNDPDNNPLYVMNLEADGTTGIYRANPASDRIERIGRFDQPPTGCFITGRWDANRWILGAVVGTTTQRLKGLELGSRISWLNLSPLEGEVPGASVTPISVTISVPNGARRGENYAGDISFRAYGGQVASVRVAITIVDGFAHFRPPVLTNDSMTVQIEEANLFDRELAVGSEIAALTPRGSVGGLIRWLGEPAPMHVYSGEQGFNVGEGIAFKFWDVGRRQEFDPEPEVARGFLNYNPDDSVFVRLNVHPGAVQTIQIAMGWSLISGYVTPADAAQTAVFREMLQRGHINLIKDGNGRFWAPRFNFNGLRDWDALSAYQVNVSAADSLTLMGSRTDPGTAIPLTGGWNTVAYLLDQNVDPRTALRGVMDAVVIAKNGRGDFIAPRLNFFGIRMMMAGEGYKVKVDRDVNLVYQARQRDEAPFDQNPSRQLTVSTGSDMSLVIGEAPKGAVTKGAELVVYTRGNRRVVGRATFEALPAAVVVRGDDTLSTSLDGALPGEILEVCVIRDGNVLAQFTSSEEVAYQTDGFRALTLEPGRDLSPEAFVLHRPFPNPFNSHTFLRYGLPTTSPVSFEIIDVTGRIIFKRIEESKSAGWHNLDVDAAEWPGGLYLVRAQAGSERQVQKLVLVK